MAARQSEAPSEGHNSIGTTPLRDDVSGDQEGPHTSPGNHTEDDISALQTGQLQKALGALSTEDREDTRPAGLGKNQDAEGLIEGRKRKQGGVSQGTHLAPILDEKEQSDSSSEVDTESSEESDIEGEIEARQVRRRSVSRRRKRSSVDQVAEGSGASPPRRASQKDTKHGKHGKEKKKKTAAKGSKTRRASISSASNVSIKPRSTRRASLTPTAAAASHKVKGKKKHKTKKTAKKSSGKFFPELVLNADYISEEGRDHSVEEPLEPEVPGEDHIEQVGEPSDPSSATFEVPVIGLGRTSSRFLQSAVFWGLGRTSNTLTGTTPGAPSEEQQQEQVVIENYEPNYGKTLDVKGSNVSSYFTEDDLIYIQEIKYPPIGNPPPDVTKVKAKDVALVPRPPFYKRLTAATRLLRGRPSIHRRHSRAGHGSTQLSPRNSEAGNNISRKGLTGVSVVRASFRLRQKMTDDTTTSSVDGPPKLENTYRMEPEPEGRFSPRDVGVMMGKLLASTLKEYTYEATNAGEMAKVLTQSVLQAAKEMTSPRYKLICHVMIGQLSNQGFLYASRCLWNAKTDTSATAEFHKPQFFCTATVHATYCE